MPTHEAGLGEVRRSPSRRWTRTVDSLGNAVLDLAPLFGIGGGCELQLFIFKAGGRHRTRVRVRNITVFVHLMHEWKDRFWSNIRRFPLGL